MKIEVGMYARTKNGEIGKIRVIIDNKIFINTNQYYSTVVKASDDITELIEEKDLVEIEYYSLRYNERVTRMFECRLFKSKEDDFVIFENKHCDWWYDKNKKEWVRAKGYNPKIKSIVTKEQFESMSYKVGE